MQSPIMCRHLLMLLTMLALLPSFQAESADRNLTRCSLVALLATPKSYHGKQIRTLGYVVYDFEESALYLSSSDAKHGIYTNAVWLEGTSGSPDLSRFAGKYVLVEGIFNAQNLGHGSLFVGGIEHITRVDELPGGEGRTLPRAE